MSISAERFRRVLGHLAGGVTIVTSRDADGRPSGFTATAVCAVSLAPPLVLVCVDEGGNTRRAVSEFGAYALNFLGGDGAELADRFATEGDKFEGVAFEPGETGSPRLAAAMAWCDCELVEEIPQGDHVILIGRVVDAGVRPDARPEPLLHFLGRYRGLERPPER